MIIILILLLVETLIVVPAVGWWCYWSGVGTGFRTARDHAEDPARQRQWSPYDMKIFDRVEHYRRS